MSKKLAIYAVQQELSKGRKINEPNLKLRNEFQRDRDRIIHSSAFRRLVYKTQVFVNHEGDLYRTRLTHSLEVSQIARTIASSLQLNEPLIEAIALAHDLGHTPFGHAGQDELNKCMKDFGGFEHNLQSLRVVERLENRYVEFNGLNLMYETREGILKHCSKKNAKKLGDLGERFLKKYQPSLEAQIADIADAITYNHHDIDDGFRAGLLTSKQLREVRLFGRFNFDVKEKYPHASERQLVHETLRRMVDFVINDLILNTSHIISNIQPKNINEIRNQKSYIAQLTDKTKEEHYELKKFLREHLYKHKTVQQMTDRAKIMVKFLFGNYMVNKDKKLNEFHQNFDQLDEPDKARVIADYIAGMTDRFAISEYNRLI